MASVSFSRHKLALVAKLTISLDKSKVARALGDWTGGEMDADGIAHSVTFAVVAVALAWQLHASLVRWQPFVCPYST